VYLVDSAKKAEPPLLDQHAYGMVISSKYRRKIIELLANSSPKTPTEIAEQTGAAINNVSNYLTTLQELGLVCCLNKELRKGRLYTLTDKGKQIHRALTCNFPVALPS
jgi:DNA-binding transcriptional ArsR family regulator